MMSGHMDVTWAADMRTSTTRKQRKTAARTSGEQGIVRRLSTMRSKRNEACVSVVQTATVFVQNLALIFQNAYLECLASVFDIGRRPSKR